MNLLIFLIQLQSYMNFQYETKMLDEDIIDHRADDRPLVSFFFHNPVERSMLMNLNVLYPDVIDCQLSIASLSLYSCSIDLFRYFCFSPYQWMIYFRKVYVISRCLMMAINISMISSLCYFVSITFERKDVCLKTYSSFTASTEYT